MIGGGALALRTHDGGHGVGAHLHQNSSTIRWHQGCFGPDAVAARAIRAPTHHRCAGYPRLYVLPMLGHISLDQLCIDDSQTMIDDHTRAEHVMENVTEYLER
jgi:hypothetical protein